MPGATAIPSARMRQSSISTTSSRSIATGWLSRTTRARAWGSVLPLICSVIIEADAWLMEQPRPTKRTSEIKPAASFT